MLCSFRENVNLKTRCLQPGPGGKHWFRVSLFEFRPDSRDQKNLRVFAVGARLQSADCEAYVFSRLQASTSADCNRYPAVNNGFRFRCSNLDPTAEAQRTSLHVPPGSACSQRALRLTWFLPLLLFLSPSLSPPLPLHLPIPLPPPFSLSFSNLSPDAVFLKEGSSEHCHVAHHGEAPTEVVHGYLNAA